MSKLGLIILAGGLSSRMGRHKALLPWTNGESLISHALRNALEHDIEDILISIGDDESLGYAIQKDILDTLSNEERNKVSIVRDVVRRSGPVGGLYSALSVGRSSAYGLLAVDMPFMDISLYYRWLYDVDGFWNAIVPMGESNRLEPMAGIYQRHIVESLQQVLNGEDVSLHHALHMIGSVAVVQATTDVDYFHNVNHFDEYVWARAEMLNTERLVPVVTVVSKERKTGKTTVVTRLVEVLSEKGLSVGVVKSDGHGFDMDHEGTDTAKAFDAGANAVAIAGPTETAIRFRTEGQTNLYHLTQQMPVDIVILETRSQGICPIIEVVQSSVIKHSYTDDQHNLVSEDNNVAIYDNNEVCISNTEDRVALVDLDTLDYTLPKLVEQIERMVRVSHGRRFR